MRNWVILNIARKIRIVITEYWRIIITTPRNWSIGWLCRSWYKVR